MTYSKTLSATAVLLAASAFGVNASAMNLLLDPGFETPEAGDAPAVVRISVPADPSLSPWSAFNTAGVTERQWSRPGSAGDQTLRLAPNAMSGTGHGQARQEFDASANEVFNFSAWVKHAAAEPLTGDRVAQLRLRWFNDQGVQINDLVLNVLDASAPTDQWFFVEIENFQLPDNESIVEIWPSLFVSNNGGSGTGPAFFDDVTFERVTISEGLPGDANGDGAVDLLDLDILGSNFGASPADVSTGDFNDDNVVDLLDLDILGSNFGATSGAEAVPEPAAVTVVCLGAVFLFCRRR